ncbi:MAG: thymidine phosphorylase, partial [Methanomicrobiales archaeon]
MKLISRLLDIADRGVLLNTTDARNLGVLHGDRVQVLNEASGISVAAYVDITASLVPPGTVGIYRVCNERLCVVDSVPLEVREAARPQSLEYITKKMNEERLSK